MLMTASNPRTAARGTSFRHRVLGWLTAASLATALPVHAAGTDELKLPNLGESSTSLFSAEYEHQLGRAWLRVFRSQVATVNDPLLFGYLEDLIFKLVTHSELQDRRI